MELKCCGRKVFNIELPKKIDPNIAGLVFITLFFVNMFVCILGSIWFQRIMKNCDFFVSEQFYDIFSHVGALPRFFSLRMQYFN